MLPAYINSCLNYIYANECARGMCSLDLNFFEWNTVCYSFCNEACDSAKSNQEHYHCTNPVINRPY